MVDGFSMPYRQDRNSNGGGIPIYIRDNIPNTLLTKFVFPGDIEGLSVELNFRKSKWYLRELITRHFKAIATLLNT